MDILSGNTTKNVDNYLNTSVVFGGLMRTIISKDFKGGKIRNLFGGTKLDFTYADITGIAVLNISQVFGEVVIAVPPDWRIEADLFHFCSVVDDDRNYSNRGYHSDKVLLIKGLSMFAVIDVVNSL